MYVYSHTAAIQNMGRDVVVWRTETFWMSPPVHQYQVHSTGIIFEIRMCGRLDVSISYDGG